MQPSHAVITALHINLGKARKLRVGARSLFSAIGKTPTQGAVAVGPLGLQGDEQADPSLHGGLEKAVYAYPGAHYAFWQEQRRAHGVSLFDEALPPGLAGENLTVDGPLENDIYVGDTLHFAHCVLRVTAPREPCSKFNAVMGFAQASKAMAQAGCCGYYLAVLQPGTINPGEQARLVPGPRNLSIAQAFAAKMRKHLA